MTNNYVADKSVNLPIPAVYIKGKCNLWTF